MPQYQDGGRKSGSGSRRGARRPDKPVQSTPKKNTPQPRRQPQQAQQAAPRQPQQGYGGYDTAQGSGQTTGGLTKAERRARILRQREIMRKKRRNRRLLIAIVFLLVVGILFFVIRHFNGSENAPTDAGLDELDQAMDLEEAAEEAAYDGSPVARIAFVGDISVSQAQVQDATRSDGTYDFAQPFQSITGYLSGVDYAVANFETTMVDDLSYGGEPYYNAPVQLAGSLRGLGFRLVSTANTYMLNNGIDGLVSTKNYLTEAKLKSVGTYLSQEDRDKDGGAYIRDLHKIRFAFLSYTKGTDSVTMPEGCEYALNTLYDDYSDYWTDLRSSQIREDIQACKDAGAEVIIALVHWGSEYSRSVNTSQETVTKLMLENGVDVIIGTHPHVVGKMGFQEVELLDGTRKQCFVAYSLGDFYTDPEKDAACSTVMLSLEFSKDDQGKVTISDACYAPLYMQITEVDNKKHFELLDIYSTIAGLERLEKMNSQQATQMNTLLSALDTIHSNAGEELDMGPQDEDMRVVSKAIEDGAFSADEIRALRDEERAAEASAKAALAAEQKQTVPEPEDVTEEPEE
ncbi:MAG: CapA family protein [Oscillospiraceae bacterium]|nr:CapA family protein [Oscillospiraceae bacterium]